MLIVPETQLLRDFPLAHAAAANEFDEKFADSNPTSFTPVLRAVNTDPDLGTDGFIEGKYITVLDMVIAWGSWIFGSGMDPGSGIYFIEIPPPIRFDPEASGLFSSGVAGRGMAIGSAFAILNRPRQATVQIRLISTPPNPSHISFCSLGHAGLGSIFEWRDNSPFAWSAGSQANWNICVRRAAP